MKLGKPSAVVDWRLDRVNEKLKEIGIGDYKAALAGKNLSRSV